MFLSGYYWTSKHSNDFDLKATIKEIQISKIQAIECHAIMSRIIRFGYMALVPEFFLQKLDLPLSLYDLIVCLMCIVLQRNKAWIICLMAIFKESSKSVRNGSSFGLILIIDFTLLT